MSVIVPALNEERYLPNCLYSLRKQTYLGNYEVIVVDGGSTDKTVEIAEGLADKTIDESVKPVGAARNTGSRAASGRLLAFLDADTVASPNWIESIVESFSSKDDAVGVAGPTLPYEGETRDLIAYHLSTHLIPRLFLTLGIPHIAGFNCAYQRDVFWRVGGFDEERTLCEDISLSFRIRREGKIVYNKNAVTYTSMRRAREYGYPYMAAFYLVNDLLLLFTGKSLEYPPVR